MPGQPRNGLRPVSAFEAYRENRTLKVRLYRLTREREALQAELIKLEAKLETVNHVRHR